MIGTIVIGIVLLALAALAVCSLIKSKKSGGCSWCSGGCDGSCARNIHSK